MKSVIAVIAAASLLASGVVYAQSGPEVLKAKGCLNCHEADKKKVGPAFKEIASKYKADKGAESALIAKLKEGKGHPKIAGSDAELKSLASFALTGK